MQLDEFLDQRQADAAAFEAAAPCAFDPVEALEDPAQLMLGNTRACVLDREFDGAAGLPQPDLDRAFEGEFERIGEEVEHDLLPHIAIHIDRLRECRAFDYQFQAGLLGSRTKIAGKLGRERRQVGRLEAGLSAPRLDA